MNIFKKATVYLLSFPLVSKGFSGARAKKWVRLVYHDMISNRDFRMGEKIWAYRRGYMPDQVKTFGITEDNLDRNISFKDYSFVQPINGIYRKWIADKVTARKVFSPFRDRMPALYYDIRVTSDERMKITALDDLAGRKPGEKRADLIRFMKEEGRVTLTHIKGNRSSLIEYRDGSFFMDGEKLDTEESLVMRIKDFNKESVIGEYVEPAEGYENSFSPFGNRLNITVINDITTEPEIGEVHLAVDGHFSGNIDGLKDLIREYYRNDGETSSSYDHGDDEDDISYFKGIVVPVDKETGEYSGGEIALDAQRIKVETDFTTGKKIEGTVPGWQGIRADIKKICGYVPQLQFFTLEILITEDGYRIMRFVDRFPYPSVSMYTENTVRFLNEKIREKKAITLQSGNVVRRGLKQTKLKIRKAFSAAFFPTGLLPYLSVRWIKEITVDFFTNRDVSFGKKMWAYRNGFISYRIPQYGITPENRKDFISDFEYKWLRHINGKYRSWFEDKITFKYILSDFKECFPQYYYHIELKDGINYIVRMMDCPEKYSDTYEDILELAKEKKVLALKPDEGSHGDGFYKLWYEDGQYYLNFDKATKEQVIDILKDPDNSYLITEYIENHPQFREIYDGAVNTIRLIVFKMDGRKSEIGNAYMRFGSKKTGAVDNMGAGGMFTQLDIETGRYGNAKIITNNSIQPCPCHPDTGVRIEGTVPHWQAVKDKILEIADSIPQLEYFGFDVAITEDGIKLPEINRFPDYPKIENLSPETMKYLLKKLDDKKAIYGYDKKKCRKLVHFPKR